MDFNELTVFIVDDDPSVRDSLSLLLSVRGYRTAVFASGESFLAAWTKEWAGCVLLDLRMPGMDGLSVQKKLAEMNCQLPVIVVTGHGDVGSAREAFKAQASDFLEKPLDDAKLIHAIEEAFSREGAARQEMRRRELVVKLLQDLTPREREVMEHVATGRHNRTIAQTLGISVRTVEVHKARLMAKLGVDNVADLVRITMLHK